MTSNLNSSVDSWTRPRPEHGPETEWITRLCPTIHYWRNDAIEISQCYDRGCSQDANFWAKPYATASRDTLFERRATGVLVGGRLRVQVAAVGFSCGRQVRSLAEHQSRDMGARDLVHVREQPVHLVVLIVVRGVVLCHVADRNLPDHDRVADRLSHLFPIGELRGPLLVAPE